MVSLQTIARIRAYRQQYERPDDVPLLEMAFPRPVTAMHQIEITSRCNLRCTYCPSHKMPREISRKPTQRAVILGGSEYRPQLDMTEAHYRRALEWASHFVKRGTQVELNLAGIGESTMHPQFVEFVGMARAAVGPEVVIVLATNGLLVTEAMARQLAPHRPSIWVSMHRPEKAGPAVQILRRHGLYAGASDHPALQANDWGGQVDWFHSQTLASPCVWQRNGFVMALADGRISSCCLDATGQGVVGHLDDPIPTVTQQPFILCRTCHQHIRVAGVKQR